MRAIGLVRADMPSAQVEAGVTALRAEAGRRGLDLDEVLVRSEGGIGRALAQIDAVTRVILVPSVLHLGAWMGSATEVAEVWAVEPPRRWPHGGGRAQPLPRPGHHLAGQQ